MLHAGLARTDISTFEPGMAMMGWGLPHHQARRVEAPLHARALVVRDGPDGAAWAFVVVELLVVSRGLWLEVLAALEARHPELGLGAHSVALAATHTHSGPSGYAHSFWLMLNAPGFSATVHDALVDGIVAAIVAAFEALAPARLVLSRGEVAPGVAFNRSWFAYRRNRGVARVRRAQRDEAVERGTVLVRVERPDGRVVGLVDWFGLHNTCVHGNHDALHSDHKGLAALTLEERHGLVALLAQECCGDVTPNFREAPARGHTVGPHDDDHVSARIVADAQVAAIEAALADPGEELTGPVQSVVELVDLGRAPADPRFTVDGLPHRTHPGTIGISMALGTAEGRGPLWPVRRVLRALHALRRGADRLAGAFGRQGHDPMLPLIDVGRGDRGRLLGLLPVRHLPPVDAVLAWVRVQVRLGRAGSAPWLPEVVPVQVLRVGALAVCTMPSEPTTVAGRRLRDTMRAAAPEGVRHVVVSPYANAYAGYLTTAEEYQVQHYEAAYTVFGPHSVAALRTVVEGLMGRLGTDRQVGELPARVAREALEAMPFERPWGKRKDVVRAS